MNNLFNKLIELGADKIDYVECVDLLKKKYVKIIILILIFLWLIILVM